MINWFEEYPYAFIHADTTPLFVAAVHNLYRQNGDKEFIQELWPALKKAYVFCLANDSDNDGILENAKAGLGASELGSLLNDLHQDIYLAAANLEASYAMIELSSLMGDQPLREMVDQKYQSAYNSINERYWDPEAGRHVFALTKSGKQNSEVTAWAAAPMMFGLLDPKRAGGTLATLSSSQISTDWGARMLSNQSPAYDPIAYNNGGVWPFLTGFVACAEYEYRRPHAGFAHVKQLAQLTFDHALGYHPEILSGDFYRPLDESVPHQLFSSGMVITPLIRGMLGLRADAANRVLRFAPQLPGAWDSLKVRNYRIGASKLSFDIRRAQIFNLRFEIAKEDDEPLKLQFSPALPALARITRVTVDGKPVKCATSVYGAGVTCNLETILRRRAVIEITFGGGIEIDAPQTAVQPGARTQSLKIIEITTPANNKLVARLEGLQGRAYTIRARGGLGVQSVQGGTLRGEEGGWKLIDVSFPASANVNDYQSRTIELTLR